VVQKIDNIGIVITCYNRPHLLKKTLDDLNSTDYTNEINRGCVIIIDDSSTNDETIKLVVDFKLSFSENWELIKIIHNKNKQMYNSLREGFDLLVANEYTNLCNLDSDVLLKSNWLLKLIRLYKMFPDTIISGFNFRLPSVIADECKFYKDGYLLKQGTGGINFLFSKETYYKYVRDAFNNKLQWDWKVSDNLAKDNKMFVITKPSVIQHNVDISDKDNISNGFNIISLDFY